MRLFAMVIRDSAADAYHAPLFFPSMGQAERWFRDEVNSSQSELAKHPEDYELYLVGAYDTQTAEIIADQTRLILRGRDALRTQQ